MQAPQLSGALKQYRGRLSWRDRFAVLLLGNIVFAEARPFPDL